MKFVITKSQEQSPKTNQSNKSGRNEWETFPGLGNLKNGIDIETDTGQNREHKNKSRPIKSTNI